MSVDLRPILRALDSVRTDPDPQTKLATVTLVAQLGVYVKFDGEAVQSEKRYQATHPCFIGMRVLMVRAGSTWIIDGDVNGGPTWTAATLVNGWQNYNAGAWPLEYRRVDGIVWQRGIVVPTVSWNSVITTIPTGPNGGGRPSNVHRDWIGQGGADYSTQMDVAANGQVVLPAAQPTTGGVSVAWVCLDSQWPAET